MNIRSSPKKINIHIYRNKNDIIIIKLKMMIEPVFILLPFELEPQYCNFDRQYNIKTGGSLDILEESFYYTRPQDRKFRHGGIQDTSKLTRSYTIEYQLPKTPHNCITFLSCLFAYLKRSLDRDDELRIYTLNLKIALDLKTNDIQPLTMKNYINLLCYIICLRKKENPGCDPYSPVFDALQKIIQDYFSGSEKIINFIKYAEIETRFRIIYKNHFDLIFNDKNSHLEKLNAVLDFTRMMIQAGQTVELSFLLKSLNHIARKHLYHAFITKYPLDFITPDIVHNYFQYAEFELLHGRMHIINIDRNPGYQRNLSAYKLSYEAFMKNFAAIMKLEFQSGENEIIFDEYSTNILKNYGLHLSEKYIKKTIFTQNLYLTLKNTTTTFFMTDDLIQRLATEVDLDQHVDCKKPHPII